MPILIVRRQFIILGAAAAGLGGCGGGGSASPDASGPVTPPVTPPPTAAILTVTRGVHAQTKTNGAVLDAFADADPAGQVFDTWTGDVDVLLSPRERRSGVKPLSRNAMVTATFRPLAAFVPQTAVLNGQPVGSSAAVNAYWYFPTALPRGVIFRFHGRGGSGEAQFTKVEELKFARDAVAEGFAVVSLDSNDRVDKSWDGTTDPANPSANADVRNSLTLINRFTTEGLMNAATPVFGSGHSAGAGAALRFAFLLNWKASHQSCVPGPLQIAQATTVPGIWTMAQNDTREEPTRNADALTASNALAARSVPTEYVVVAPSAVYQSRFTQIPGLGVSDSGTLYTAVKAAGLLDSADYQIKDPTDVNFTSVVPNLYAAFTKDVEDQMRVAYAAHQFSSATDQRVLAFFKARPS